MSWTRSAASPTARASRGVMQPSTKGATAAEPSQTQRGDASASPVATGKASQLASSPQTLLAQVGRLATGFISRSAVSEELALKHSVGLRARRARTHAYTETLLASVAVAPSR
eukprot:5630973-Prymnesium_polylepis.1